MDDEMNERLADVISLCEEYGVQKSERCKKRFEPHSVYTISENGKILYIGMTVNIRSRMYDHKTGSSFWSESCECTVEVLPTRRAALNRERELIKQLKPPFNKMHNA